MLTSLPKKTTQNTKKQIDRRFHWIKRPNFALADLTIVYQLG
ncbi:hypothetical protein E9O_06848 [Moraxella catarrhalis 12P80B1]|nr:hypothetical protein E9O_06848 [Moraxella catarrhalis 12P80B1]